VTPDPGFKVTVVLKGEYLQSDAFYRHSCYIGRIRTPGTLSIGKLAIQLTTTPLLLRKPCKLFARFVSDSWAFLLCFTVSKSEHQISVVLAQLCLPLGEKLSLLCPFCQTNLAFCYYLWLYTY